MIIRVCGLERVYFEHPVCSNQTVDPLQHRRAVESISGEVLSGEMRGREVATLLL